MDSLGANPEDRSTPSPPPLVPSDDDSPISGEAGRIESFVRSQGVTIASIVASLGQPSDVNAGGNFRSLQHSVNASEVRNEPPQSYGWFHVGLSDRETLWRNAVQNGIDRDPFSPPALLVSHGHPTSSRGLELRQRAGRRHSWIWQTSFRAAQRSQSPGQDRSPSPSVPISQSRPMGPILPNEVFAMLRRVPASRN